MIIDILVETNEVSAREIYIRLQAQRKGMQTWSRPGAVELRIELWASRGLKEATRERQGSVDGVIENVAEHQGSN